jgi:hypothetical protein
LRVQVGWRSQNCCEDNEESANAPEQTTTEVHAAPLPLSGICVCDRLPQHATNEMANAAE